MMSTVFLKKFGALHGTRTRIYRIESPVFLPVKLTVHSNWSPHEDLNPRPPDPKSGALPD